DDGIHALVGIPLGQSIHFVSVGGGISQDAATVALTWGQNPIAAESPTVGLHDHLFKSARLLDRSIEVALITDLGLARNAVARNDLIGVVVFGDEQSRVGPVAEV